MKRVTTAVIAMFCVVTFSNAQMKPEGGEWGLGFHVTGLANVAFGNWSTTGLNGAVINDPLSILPPGTTVGSLVPQNVLFGRYYLSSDLALRMTLGINSLSAKTHTVDSVGTGIETIDDNTSAFSFGIGAGIEKHFATSASRLDPYAGAEFQIGMLGSIKNEMTDNTEIPSPGTNTLVTSNTTWDGGMSWSFNLLGGFNYFFSDYFAIGAEVSWGIMGMSIGGEYVNDTETTVAGVTTTSQPMLKSERII
jgi:hypothetical protein